MVNIFKIDAFNKLQNFFSKYLNKIIVLFISDDLKTSNEFIKVLKEKSIYYPHFLFVIYHKKEDNNLFCKFVDTEINVITRENNYPYIYIIYNYKIICECLSLDNIEIINELFESEYIVNIKNLFNQYKTNHIANNEIYKIYADEFLKDAIRRIKLTK